MIKPAAACRIRACHCRDAISALQPFRRLLYAHHSHRSRSPIAQLVEHSTVNRMVAGSKSCSGSQSFQLVKAIFEGPRCAVPRWGRHPGQKLAICVDQTAGEAEVIARRIRQGRSAAALTVPGTQPPCPPRCPQLRPVRPGMIRRALQPEKLFSSAVMMRPIACALRRDLSCTGSACKTNRSLAAQRLQRQFDAAASSRTWAARTILPAHAPPPAQNSRRSRRHAMARHSSQRQHNYPGILRG